MAILPGFVLPEAFEDVSRMASERKRKAHLEDVWGTPYLELADESYPEGHPRRTRVHNLTGYSPARPETGCRSSR